MTVPETEKMDPFHLKVAQGSCGLERETELTVSTMQDSYEEQTVTNATFM